MLLPLPSASLPSVMESIAAGTRVGESVGGGAASVGGEATSHKPHETGQFTAIYSSASAFPLSQKPARLHALQSGRRSFPHPTVGELVVGKPVVGACVGKVLGGDATVETVIGEVVDSSPDSSSPDSSVNKGEADVSIGVCTGDEVNIGINDVGESVGCDDEGPRDRIEDGNEVLGELRGC